MKLSALLMLRRLVHAVEYARREENVLPVVSAGAFLVLVGTVSYALGEDWNLVDALYFAVTTLTTTSVSDPDLVLEHAWMKVFTVFYILIGIGILVEVIRRLGVAFVATRIEESRRDAAGKAEPS